MARLLFTEQFMEDAETLWSPRVREHLLRIVRALETFPQSGSSQVPESVTQEFGKDVRKFALNPFDLVYEYDSETDTVTLLGFISQRRVK